MSSKVGRVWGMARASGLVLGMLLAGCEKPDPNKPLTVDQQSKLLKDIRSNPKRTQDLTPAEKQYLRQKLGR